jgi:hypothetical protein
MAEKTADRELGWNDPIENDGSDWVLLPAGEYPFRVEGLERKRFEGSAKLPPCNEACLTVEVGDAEASTTIQHRLYLHSKTEGLLCAFFRAIGARKHGERVVMDWGKVIGATGRCKVGVREWTAKDGGIKTSNQIEKFLDPAEATDGAPAQGEMPF